MSGHASELGELCDALESALRGSARCLAVDAVVADDPGVSLGRLRSVMHAPVFRSGSGTVELERLVRRLDHRTRRDGFRVLHSWDHTAHEFTDDITPVLMLDYFVRAVGDEFDVRVVCEVILDYYFLHLLALCAMRAWDADDPDAHLDRVTGLVDDLQGADGSGHRFVDDAETLIIYALSQFHPDEHAYDRFIEKVTTLRLPRQVRFARASAAVLSSHLRWGFWLMYDRDVLRMRNDNVGDYPWLLISVLTLLREYAACVDGKGDAGHRDRVVDGLLQGLAADPWAFTGKAPPALAEYEAEHEEARGLLGRHGADLLLDFETVRPSKEAYSPLSLHYNFPHNTLVALVTMALLAGAPQQLPINALLARDGGRVLTEGAGDAGGPGGGPDDPDRQERLARALMEYSGATPERLGYHGAMLVAYDPLSGLRTYTMTVRAIREFLEGA